MNIRKILCAALAILTLLCAAAMADIPKPSEQFYYLDKANVLSEATEGEIFFSNQLLENACGAQIVVVTVDSTQPYDIADYCFDLFNSWGIGDAKKKNGFLILLAIGDENYYSVCGDNLQSKFTAAELNEYFDAYLEDDFAAGIYDVGVKKFFEAVFKRISDTYSARVTTDQGIAAYQKWASQANREPMAASGRGGGLGDGAYARAEEENSNFSGSILALVVLIVIFVLIINSMRRRAYTRTYGTRPSVFFVPSIRRAAPPPRGPYGPGMGPGPGGMRGGPGAPPPPRSSSGGSGLFGSSRSSSGGGFSFGRAFGSGRSSFGSGRSSGGSRSFGSARGGGGTTRGGGAGRGRH